VSIRDLWKLVDQSQWEQKHNDLALIIHSALKQHSDSPSNITQRAVKHINVPCDPTQQSVFNHNTNNNVPSNTNVLLIT